MGLVGRLSGALRNAALAFSVVVKPSPEGGQSFGGKRCVDKGGMFLSWLILVMRPPARLRGRWAMLGGAAAFVCKLQEECGDWILWVVYGHFTKSP